MIRSTVSFGLIRTLGFYRDLLGLRVIADSTATASEVAELLGLDSVQLRIADLDSGDGRVVELIEYLQPKGRRLAYEATTWRLRMWRSRSMILRPCAHGS